jgi:arginine utilization protein RocB
MNSAAKLAQPSKSVEAILVELINVQSDSGTKLECDMGAKLMDLLSADPYFKDHPEQFGAYADKDMLHRPVVWALKRGRSNKTVILNGHYDAVEIDSYGVLKPFALDPALLKEKMLETNLVDEQAKICLKDPDWLFGRGAADMKCGIAINLQTLFAAVDRQISILFTAVCDEENLSAGARQAIDLYQQLKDRFDLDYRLAIVTEPDLFKKAGEPFNIMTGTAGKLLPIVVAKGRISHGALMLGGLNPSLIIAEIVRRVELSDEFQSRSYGCATHPPTTLFMKDLKETYDVSLPEYCVAGFNLLFLYPTNPLDHVVNFRRICELAVDSAVQKYNSTFDALTNTGIMRNIRAEFQPEVLLVSELRQRLQLSCPDFESRMARLEAEILAQLSDQTITIHDAGINYVKSMIEMVQTTQPMVVLGFFPPFYPSVSTGFFNQDIPVLLKQLENQLENEGRIQVTNGAFIPGPTDMSYFACPDLDSCQSIMANMSLPQQAYQIDFETLARLSIPSIQIGAACAAVHEIGERVYLPDVTNHVPYIIEVLIDRL